MIINIAGGRGVMGQVHKPIFEASNHKVIISGRNSKPNLEEAAEQADLTIVSVPIQFTEEIIRKLAPRCRAIMDFTSLKTFPVEAMLRYSSSGCEVAGLHPLYGKVDLIKGRNVVYCQTERSGAKCKEIVRCLETAGANIKETTPETHDYLMAVSQNMRVMLLETLALSLERIGIGIAEAYDLSPPPTKVMLDLLARQVSPNNDELYRSMIALNPFQADAERYFLESFRKISSGGKSPQDIRDFFGEELERAQERAKRLI